MVPRNPVSAVACKRVNLQTAIDHGNHKGSNTQTHILCRGTLFCPAWRRLEEGSNGMVMPGIGGNKLRL
jgi:hypothetical protein